MSKKIKYMIFTSFLFVCLMPVVRADNLYHVCEYENEFVFQYGGGTLTDNNVGDCDDPQLTFDLNDLGTNCPQSLYYYYLDRGNTRYCDYNLQSGSNGEKYLKIPLYDEYLINEAGEKFNLDGTPFTTATTKNPSSGCGILGGTDSKTVNLLSWVVKLIRLGIPIVIIVLGMIDFLTILFSGEDKVYKEAFSKFVKRVLIGIIIIFIPYVLHFLVRLSGVDKQYNIDNFFCGIIDTVSGVTGDEVDVMEADPDSSDDSKSKVCYICQDSSGKYSQHWTEEEPTGYASCNILTGQTEDTCLHG